jgi:hypothetical protein
LLSSRSFSWKKSLSLSFLGFALIHLSCAALFGWDIHAPGILSSGFSQRVQPLNSRVALYVDPAVWTYQSKDRGGRMADPQTFHVGESYGPMLIEGFQESFEEFIFMEIEPDAAVLKRYGIDYLAAVKIKRFGNRVTMKGQAVQLVTETVVFDGDLKVLARFESTGTSDAEKIFAKKGGPEVNLNAALENNILAIVEYLQDSIHSGVWPGDAA